MDSFLILSENELVRMDAKEALNLHRNETPAHKEV